MSAKWSRAEVEGLDQLIRGFYRASQVVGLEQAAHSVRSLILILALDVFKTEDELIEFMHAEGHIAEALKEKPV